MSDELSLQDELRAAFSEQEKESEKLMDSDTGIDERARDEQGRFAAKEKEAEEEKKAPETEEQKAPETEEQAKTEEQAPEQQEADPQVLNTAKAPSSWSPKVREHWNALPEDVRKEIIRREEASIVGVRKLQEEFAPVRQFTESLAPFLQDAAQNGFDPGQHVRNTMAAERALRTGDVNSRFNALLSIADQYGIPLRQAINSAAGQQILPETPQQPQIPPEVARELEEARRFREQYAANSYEQQIAQFSQGKEFFEDVRGLMADMIDSGLAKDLNEAYEKATWAHPEVREVLLQRERLGKKNEDLKSRQAAAAGASVKTGGSADVKVDVDDENDSLEATLRKAMRAHSGRV